MNDLGSTPHGEAPTVASLSDRRARVVRAALDDGYETSELPEWLVTFLTEIRYVRRDGTYYRLNEDLPQYEFTARETTEADVEGRIADRETYREAMTHDGVVSSGLLRHARQGGVTVTDPWPGLLAFVRTYDAVRFRGDLLAVSLTVTGDDPPYTVVAERVSPTAVADGSVFDATNASRRVRKAVRAAGETSGVYADDVPETLLDAVASHQYVYLDETFYWAGLERRGELPVTVEVTVTDAAVAGADSPRIRLTLVNESDENVSVTSGAPPPFGVLHLRGPDDESRLLWTDAYRESDHVGTDGRSVTFVESVGVVSDLPANGRRSRTYAVLGELPPGDYRLRGNVGVRTDDEQTLPYRISLRVTE